ncbi:MAG: hypothetical protein DRJ64_04945 [Thermoprotei archaeon]|nr:MAG: hypothetical protein DRJ64_04945 [Thermoprotei archaeon]
MATTNPIIKRYFRTYIHLPRKLISFTSRSNSQALICEAIILKMYGQPYHIPCKLKGYIGTKGPKIIQDTIFKATGTKLGLEDIQSTLDSCAKRGKRK